MPSSNPPPPSQSLSTLLSHLTPFLTISIHHLLHLRHIYPLRSFLLTKAYNYPVYQSRHPAVCNWISSASEAVGRELGRGNVGKVGVVIFLEEVEEEEGEGEEEHWEEGEEYGKGGGGMRVLERWNFDLGSLPRVPRGEERTEFEEEVEEEFAAAAEKGSKKGKEKEKSRMMMGETEMVDLEEQFRATLARMSTAARRLKPLPTQGGGVSFSVVVEMRDEEETSGFKGERPVGSSERGRGSVGGVWVAGEVERMGEEEGKMRKKKRIKVIPVRRVEWGRLGMEVWVEEVVGDDVGAKKE